MGTDLRVRSLGVMLATLIGGGLSCSAGRVHTQPDGGGDAARPGVDATGLAGDRSGSPADGADRPDRPDASADLGGDVGVAGPRLANGRPCAAAADCESGFCADGVCCNSACTGTCVTCAAQNSRGLCLPA